MKIRFEFQAIFCFSLIILGSCAFYGDYASYNDLLQLNTSCSPQESCLAEREMKDYPNLSEYPCNCHPQCWQYDTCCIDSPFRRYTNPLMECRMVKTSPHKSAFLMVSKCPYNTGSDSIWKNLCEDEWNDDKDDDILKLAPVTSRATNVTYKNIYCFRCHERSKTYFQWDLILTGKLFDIKERQKNYTLSYSQSDKTWIAESDDKSVVKSVKLNFRFPGFLNYSLVPAPKKCDWWVTTKCNDSWTDNYVRDMCHAYTSYRYTQTFRVKKYKNPHCALCNYEPLDQLVCEGKYVTPTKDFFSFYHLLKIKRDDKNKTGKLQSCKENEIFDPYRNRCSKLVCAVPGYVVKNGQCSRP